MPRPPVSAAVSRACFVGVPRARWHHPSCLREPRGQRADAALPQQPAVTTEHFQYVLSGTNGDALRNTLIFSGIAAPVSAVFALFAGWLVQRGKWPGRRALDLLLILPAAIPGIFFGLGYLLAFNQRWLDSSIEACSSSSPFVLLEHSGGLSGGSGGSSPNRSLDR